MGITKEIWKDIKDFEGIYQISNYGERTKKSIDKRSKSICMFDKNGNHIKTYKNGVEAFKETGISKSHICDCCRNRYGRKTAGGYVWKYESSVVNEC